MPWVGRERYDAVVGQREGWRGDYHREQAQHEAAKSYIAEQSRMYADLLEKYHALKLQGAALPEPEKTVPAPKRPPAIVYRAMRAISPRDDATFAANWRLWEENQDECNNDPEKFAERIKRGRMTPEQPRAD